MIKIQGENGIKVTNLIKAISELYYLNDKQSLDLLVDAITSSEVIDSIQNNISKKVFTK